MIEIIPLEDEFGETNYDLSGQAWDLIKGSGINILSDKDVHLVAIDGSMVVGALYTSLVGDKYSFDVIVHPDYQRRGIGRKLIQEGINEYGNLDGVDMELDVVNPHMRSVLEDHGLSVKERIGNDRYIMGSGGNWLQ